MDVRRIEEEVDPYFLSDAHSRTGLAESGDSCESKSKGALDFCSLIIFMSESLRFSQFLMFLLNFRWCLLRRWCWRFMGKRTNVNARSRRSTKVDESKLCDIPVVCDVRTLIMEEAHTTKYSVRPEVNETVARHGVHVSSIPDKDGMYIETDGQSERTFRTLENMFRACVRNLVVVGILTFCEAEIGESKMIGLELEQETTKVVVIKERPKEAKDLSPWKGVVRFDKKGELAPRLTHEEQEKYTIEERARLLAEFFERRKKQLAAERAEAIRNKPPTRTQVRNRMITYLKHMGKYTHQQLKHKNFEEVQKLYEREKKWIDDFKPIDDDSQQQAESTKKRPRADSEEESSKKQKLEEDNDAEKEELRDSMDVVPRDDVAIDVESLATKYPIVDWKTHILNENMMYYQIIRADGSSKNYKIFSEMLDDFDRQDVIDLHRLVNERYETTSPEGYDLLLWGDLKTLFEPNEEDEIWKNQQDYNLISWRLFDSCGVHVLLMNTRVAIHMMIEKKYPLTQEMLSRMLNRRLEVDYESEMAFELLRFTRSQLQK
ncbi:hypothetical protein Tco_0157219 [Tanacetum coccineum]